MKKVYLVNGLPRSGKDTLADYLVKHHGFQKLSFADIMKDIVCRSFGISKEKLDYFKNNNVKLIAEETNGYTEELLNFRRFLQLFASEGMKPIFGDDVWSNVVYKQILASDHNKFVIADFRFFSEYQPQSMLDIKTILVKDMNELPTDGHSSDVELYQNNFKFDYTIINDKRVMSLEDYYNTIEEILC